MPYRNAHYYLLGLMVLTGLAFWPSYFSVLPSASFAIHAHGSVHRFGSLCSRFKAFRRNDKAAK